MLLNPFPSLLVYGFFVPTLLRIAAAVVFIYVAQSLLRERVKVETMTFPIVGRVRGWMLWLSVSITLLVSFCLFVGFEVQWAALLGMVIALKHAIFAKQYPTIIPLPRSTYLLLLVLCISLLFSGAGAYAFDLPI